VHDSHSSQKQASYNASKKFDHRHRKKYMVNASPELDALALFGELRHVRFKSRQDSAKFRTSPTSSKKF
jgi:hypothetical protein